MCPKQIAILAASIIGGLLIFTWIMFVLYTSVMNLKRNESKLTPIVKPFAYFTLYVGLALDVLFNFIIISIMLLEIPPFWKGELLATQRLERHLHNQRHNWRDTVCRWFVINFLNPFDHNPKGHINLKTADK